jgi:hypothetical protein
MDKIETSIENYIGVISEHNNIKNYEWSIRDINNVETADRKLIINKKQNFWVHDDALTSNSDYFCELFDNNQNEILNTNKSKNENA